MRAALLCLVLVVGCKEKNPNYCPDNPQNLCDQVDAAESCSATKPCTTGVCKEPPGICVECIDNATCMGAEPICDTATNTCGKCTSHAQCTSGVCLVDGSCADPAQVAYLAPQTGNDNDMCTQTAKCTVFAKALATNRPIIKLEGACSESVVIDRSVQIYAEQNPRAKFNKTSGTLVEARGSTDIAIYDAEINGGGNQTIGVSIPAGQATKLRLARVLVAKNGAGGVLVGSGTSDISIIDSRIDGNLGGGIQVLGTTTKYTIVNNFIVFNGLDTALPSAFGGAELTGNQAGNTFAFNTVAINKSDGNRAAGLDCGGVMSTVNGNIFYANTEPANGTGDLAQKRGTCTYQTNLVAGMNVGTAPDLGFESPRAAPFSFKLTTSSPMQVKDVISANCAMTDFEGDARPSGTACDLGADELKQ